MIREIVASSFSENSLISLPEKPRIKNAMIPSEAAADSSPLSEEKQNIIIIVQRVKKKSDHRKIIFFIGYSAKKLMVLSYHPKSRLSSDSIYFDIFFS